MKTLLLAAAAAIIYAAPHADAATYMYKRHCSIARPNGPLIHADCVVEDTMAQGIGRDTLTMPDGKKHTIDFDLPKDRYWVDNLPATMTDNGDGSCYQTRRIAICTHGDRF
jgi:hypothetical protein